MESKDELKETDFKNDKCYYLDEKVRVIDADFSDTILNEKSYEIF